MNEFGWLRLRLKNDPLLQFVSAARRLNREVVREVKRVFMPIVIWLNRALSGE